MDCVDTIFFNNRKSLILYKQAKLSFKSISKFMPHEQKILEHLTATDIFFIDLLIQLTSKKDKINIYDANFSTEQIKALISLTSDTNKIFNIKTSFPEYWIDIHKKTQEAKKILYIAS
ncbi:MAG: hypothetical protein N4A33_00045 [Bacteriovoracaceae bacterium]|jgi:hypothetical protein|nr:hypothetical protein [Bacteriovoracaceae bacterium]